MTYFKLLDLKSEPFANSPDPDFLYLSEGHLNCLQKIELAVRLRRGLNLVLGEVGTGKTTVCRELLLRLKNFNEERPLFEVQMIMDPEFESPLEFLQAVAQGFGLVGEQSSDSDRQLKEKIKNHLFQKGIDEGKILVLLIDEGQKLSPFCLETLREFLNYETNEAKLLQIVIFAQNEFTSLLARHRNFTDRINQQLHLKPLGFFETKKMIEHRLDVAAGGERTPPFFNGRSYLAIWLRSGGYPRRIVSLCHQLMLAMIIRETRKLKPALVRECAENLPARKARRLPLLPAIAAGLALALAGAVYLVVFGFLGLSAREETKTAATTLPKEVAAVVPETVAPGTAPTKPEVAVVEETPTHASEVAAVVPVKKAPPSLPAKESPILGVIPMPRHGTLSDILWDVHGELSLRRLQVLLEHNPRIERADMVRSGMRLVIPALPVATAPPRERPFIVELTALDSLEKAYLRLRQWPDNLPPARLFIYGNQRQGMVYSLRLRDNFYDAPSASGAMAALGDWSAGARVIGSWDGDTVFYSAF